MCSKKTEDLNLSIFNMITGVNESKALKKMYQANVNINVNFFVESVIQIKSGIMINVNVSVKYNISERDYIWNPATCICENDLASIIDNSVTMCDEIIDGETETVPINFNERKVAYKTQNF